MKKIAIIGGSGFYDFPLAGRAKKRKIKTPYGEAAVMIVDDLIFVARHGYKHQLPPHLVNYQANIYALKMLGAEAIIALFAVGALDKKYRPGDLVLLEDFIDLTKGRPATFSDKNKVLHTDMSVPYDRTISGFLSEAIRQTLNIRPREAVYVAAEGPRFETRAEIRYFRSIGGGVVGMTGVPEVVLANELEIPYAGLAIVTNYACGLAAGKLSQEEVSQVVADRQRYVEKILSLTIGRIKERGGHA